MRTARVAAFLVPMLLASMLSAAEQKLTASHGSASDWFGFSVGISGDTAIVGSILDFVGANVDQGSATIFTRANNVWSEQATLIAPDGAARDEFGLSVAIDGDTAVVGAYKDDIGANENQGSVWIFVRNGSTWTQQAKLIANDGEDSDLFGYSVAIDGNTVVIGAVGVDVGPYASYGAAYVFSRTGSSWNQQAKLVPTGGFTSDNFGLEVAIDGNTLVVSTGSHDVGANQNQGAAWVYVRSGNSWTQQAKLTASDAKIYDEFGRSIAIDGSTIVVGSLAKIGANEYQGAAYIFERIGGAWTEQTRVTASDGAYNDRFGISVALEGDTFVVGSYGDDLGEHENQGSIYIYTRDQGTWRLKTKRSASDGATYDDLGVAVAISGDDIIATAYGDDVGSNLDQGSAYIFNVSSSQQRKRAARK